MSDGRREALEAGFRAYHQRNTVCRATGCAWGFTAPAPLDIDPYTEEPRRVPCPDCKGTGFVPRQQELPF